MFPAYGFKFGALARYLTAADLTLLKNFSAGKRFDEIVHRRTVLLRASDDRIPPALEAVSDNDKAGLQHIPDPEMSVPVFHPALTLERSEHDALDFRKALEDAEPLFHRRIFSRGAHESLVRRDSGSGKQHARISGRCRNGDITFVARFHRLQ
jgi:hypothetical protein